MYDRQFRRALAELSVFHAVGSTEQVTLAAEALEMPQPSVSRSLARLSELLGVRLVVRSGRGVRLTEAGRTLMPYLTRGLAEVEAGLNQIQVRAPRPGGTLRLAFQNSLGEEAVPRAIRRYSASHPDVEYKLVQGTRALCIGAVEDRTADVALVSPGVEPGFGLTGVRLWAEPLVLVVAARSELSSETAVSMEILRDENFILLSHSAGLRAQVRQLCTTAGFEPTVAYEIDDAHTIRGLVSAGLGISVLPKSTAPVPGVVEIPLTDASAFRHVDAVWSGAIPNRLATEFIEELRLDRRSRRE